VHANRPPTAASDVVSAIEAAWRAIHDRHSDLADVVVVIGSGRAGREKGLWGHHWPGRWTAAGSGVDVAELFIAGELLGLGGTRIFQTILHEAAHALAHARGIKDHSRSGNRYHNRRFAQLATELGLTPPQKHSPANGYSDCTLEAETVAVYQSTIDSLDAAVTAYLADRPAKPTTYGRSGRRFVVACACGRRLQVSPRSYEDGPIICGRCGSAFRPTV